MDWTAEEIAAATGGTLSQPESGRVRLTGVTTDSRQARPGQLFVAIRAERDGHEFIAAAVEAGCSAVMLDRPDQMPESSTVANITVADTSVALLDIGRAARRRLGGPVVGITGSVGKTSVKDLAAAAVSARYRTAASYQSFNNELGVPLTLANAPESTEVSIVEMGARGVGHIAMLCELARPTVGVVTAVNAAHSGPFGGIEKVAVAKGELVESLPASGTAILNADDERVSAMAERTSASVVTYSVGERAASLVATDVELDQQLRARFVVHSPWGTVPVQLEVRGLHQVSNALAALAVAGTCGVDLDTAVGGLAKATLSPWRMDLQRAQSGAMILNDAYNANPASMSAALQSLVSLPAQRHIAVVGEMAELGSIAADEHRDVAALARRLGVELIAVGTNAYGVEPVDGVEGAVAALGPLGPGDAVLVKASRVVGLERVAARLLDAGERPRA